MKKLIKVNDANVPEMVEIFKKIIEKLIVPHSQRKLILKIF